MTFFLFCVYFMVEIYTFRCSAIFEVHFFIYFFFYYITHKNLLKSINPHFSLIIYFTQPPIFPLFQTNFNPNQKTLLVLNTFFSTFKHIFLYLSSTNFPHFYFSTFCSSQPSVI